MTIGVGDHAARWRLKPQAVGDAGRLAPRPAVIFVLPGCERFVLGLGPDACTRATPASFANGELHFRVPGDVAGRRCIIVGSISPPAGGLERLTLVAHALRRAGASTIAALLPYLAYARQDRAAATESLGLAWVGQLLCASGVDEVISVDVHSARAADLLGLMLTSLSPARLLAAALPAAWRSDVTFVAPDEGAIERCAALARAAGASGPVVWARKRRTAAGVEHHGLTGRAGKRALVVDDILDTGDTLISCCRALRDAGVQQIGVVVTHGLFTGQRWHALIAEGVRAIWITDTVLAQHRPPQAEVVPVAPLLEPVLKESRYSRRL